jgi:hypothetical protein
MSGSRKKGQYLGEANPCFFSFCTTTFRPSTMRARSSSGTRESEGPLYSPRWQHFRLSYSESKDKRNQGR